MTIPLHQIDRRPALRVREHERAAGIERDGMLGDLAVPCFAFYFFAVSQGHPKESIEACYC